MSIDDHDDQCESEYTAGGFTDCGCVARVGVGVTKLEGKA